MLFWGGVATAAAALLALLWARRRFERQLQRLETAIVTRSGRGGAEPPDEVRALAERAGATSSAGYVLLHQQGEMWSAPGAPPMRFQARQIIALNAPHFMWRAEFEPLGMMRVADYSAPGESGLEARLLGAVTMMREAGAGAERGERMRYLGELAWAPDALLSNAELDWRLANGAIVAGCGKGAERAEVRLTLGPDGLIEGGEADARPRAEKGGMVERPWGGRFWNYQRMGGRMVPSEGEAFWMLDGERFVYWRARVTSWRCVTEEAAG